MVGKNVLSFATLVASVSANAAPGFPFQTSTTLNVTYGSNNVSPGGELLPRAELASQPNITTPTWRASESGPVNGVLLMVDSDVPRNGTRVELLHWLVSGVTVSGNTLSFPNQAEAQYISPNPPVGDSPHAYTFILFEQPGNFSVPAQFQDVLQSRVFFNTSNFVRAAGLGQPMAAQWIQVQNLTGSPTTTFPPPRATNGTGSPTSSGTPDEFPGTAPSLMAEKMLWVSGLAAVLTGVAAFAL